MVTEIRPQGRARRRRRWIWVSLLVVVLVWIAAVGAMLVVARSDVNRGVDRLQSTQSRLTPDAVARGVGRSDLQAARDDFSSAHDLVGSFVVKPFEILPFVGRQVKSVDKLTSAATRVVEIGDHAISDVQAKLKEKPKTGPERIALLEQLHAIASSALTQIHQVDLGPSEALVGPVADARKKFVAKLDQATTSLADADALAAGMAKLLRGPSNYLVLAANNAEMRSGSGTLLSAGVLTIQDGKFTLGDLRPTGDLLLPSGAVPVPGALAATWGFVKPTEDFRNLATSPRFDVNAPLAAQMWKSLTGQQVDGVLALDPVTLRAFIAAEGPVDVDGVQLNADNVVRFVLHDQYQGAENTGPQAARRDRLSAIAKAVIDAFDQRDWQPSTLLKELSSAVDGRHILAWSSEPVEQQGWVGAGMAGTLSKDSLLVSMINFSGTKLDQFLDADATLSATKTGQGSDVTLQLHVKNDAPLGEPSYVTGPYPGTGDVEGEYKGQVAFNLPANARQVALTGTAPLTVSGTDGPTQVVAASIDLHRGEERVVTVRFHLPAGEDHLVVEPSARVPAIHWHFGGQAWDDTADRSLAW